MRLMGDLQACVFGFASPVRNPEYNKKHASYHTYMFYLLLCVFAWPWQQGSGYSRIESSTCATIPTGALGEGFLETGFVFLVRGGIMRAPLVHTPAVLYMATKCLWHRNDETRPIHRILKVCVVSHVPDECSREHSRARQKANDEATSTRCCPRC